MDPIKTSEFLTSLIEMNNERLKTYEIASMQVKELELKLLFSRFTQTSKRCNDELNKIILPTGAAPAGVTKSTVNLFDLWMEVRATLLGNDKQAIIKSCESAEIKILEKYQHLLSNERENFTTQQYTLISEQHALIKSDFEEIIQLKKHFHLA